MNSVNTLNSGLKDINIGGLFFSNNIALELLQLHSATKE